MYSYSVQDSYDSYPQAHTYNRALCCRRYSVTDGLCFFWDVLFLINKIKQNLERKNLQQLNKVHVRRSYVVQPNLQTNGHVYSKMHPNVRNYPNIARAPRTPRGCSGGGARVATSVCQYKRYTKNSIG